ncbi:MAG: hypothetical protein ACON4W_01920 [Parvibaculales bacterium]
MQHAKSRPAAVTFTKTHRPTPRALLGYLRHCYVAPPLRRLDAALSPYADRLGALIDQLLSPVMMFFALKLEPSLRRLITQADTIIAPWRKQAGDLVFDAVDTALDAIQKRLQIALETLFTRLKALTGRDRR